MVAPDEPSVRSSLRSASSRALKQRDSEAVRAYRTALAAIDNAEAVPLGDEHRAGAIEASTVGSADVPRRLLTEEDMIEIVRAEAEDRRVSAELVAGTHHDVAARLRREANLLLAVVEEHE